MGEPRKHEKRRPDMTSSISIRGTVTGSPGSRACCLLAPRVLGNRIIEVGDIKAHVYGNGGLLEGKEQWGIVYTCAAGFLDVAHMRDMIDLTNLLMDLGVDTARFQFL